MALTPKTSNHKIMNQIIRKLLSPLTASQRLVSSSATFQTKPFKLHKMDDSPNTDVRLEREDALKYYRQMLTIRRMEAAANSLYKDKSIRGFCHLYSGQEAIAVGMESAIRSAFSSLLYQ